MLLSIVTDCVFEADVAFEKVYRDRWRSPLSLSFSEVAEERKRACVSNRLKKKEGEKVVMGVVDQKN